MTKSFNKNQKTIKIIDAILVISILAIVILATPLILAKFKDNPKSIQEILNSCMNQNIENSSKCVINATSGFYKYNLDNIGKDLTFSQLVDEGGVCSNWSEYYSNLGENLGYNSENVFIKISDGIYHEFSVWSNDESYCVIDQTEFHCFDFGGN